MKNVSKLLLAIGAASGVAAYLINKVSSKKDEPTFEDTLELYQSDLENMNFDEFSEFMRSLDEREIPSDLTPSERTEYLDAVSVLSDNIEKKVTQFHKSGDISDEEADIISQVFGAIDSTIGWAKHQMD